MGIIPTDKRKMPSGLSPSSIDLYHQCPRRFEIEKCQPGRAPSGKEALLGTFVHRILELVMQQNPNERTLNVAKESAKVAWDEISSNEDFIALDLDAPEIQKFKWNGWTSIENYFEMEDPTEIEVVATEQYISCEVNGIPLRGIVDRLDMTKDGLVISDYKNGKKPKKRYEKPKRDQLNIYAAMIETINGQRPSKGRLIFTSEEEFMDVQFSNLSIIRVMGHVKKTWESVQKDFVNDDFKPNPGPLCGWCPYIAHCPEGMAHAKMQIRMKRMKTTAPNYDFVNAM